MLQLYGLMGKSLLKQNEQQSSWQYLYKYSKLSHETLIEYIKIKQEYGQTDDIREAISRSTFDNSILSKSDWQHVLRLIFLGEDDTQYRYDLLKRLFDL